MGTELRKRLKEATEEYADMVATTEERGWMDRTDIYAIAKDAHTAGLELGYKEAIERAKKWFSETSIKKYLYDSDGRRWFNITKFLADFKTDMNKLWEDKK